MNNAHWLLLGLWIIYCFIHSWLAGITVKNYIQKFTGKAFKFYRPLYSVFAMLTLGLILWYQFSIKSPWLFPGKLYLFIPGLIAALTGSCIMIICIYKYFYELSGLLALQKSGTKNTLQQSGLHQFVRHPLYLGTLLFIWGLFLIFPLLNNLIACIVITLYTLFGIGLEEKKLRLEFGESYIEYARKVPKLIPDFNGKNIK